MIKITALMTYYLQNVTAMILQIKMKVTLEKIYFTDDLV